MSGDRIRRYSWQRVRRPRGWAVLMFSGAPTASHSYPKSGGYRSVRAHIHELRAKEAAEFETLTVNEGVESNG